MQMLTSMLSQGAGVTNQLLIVILCLLQAKFSSSGVEWTSRGGGGGGGGTGGGGGVELVKDRSPTAEFHAVSLYSHTHALAAMT